MAFHDIRLPEDIEQGATGGPEFQTTIIPLTSGAEQRNADWGETRHSYELAYGIQTKSDYSIARSFFFARRGKANTFRFKDWGDYELEDEVQGIGDGANKTFQLIKVYESDGPDPYVRRITRPVEGTIVWRVDGVVASVTENPLGEYVLTSAPADGAVVTASGEFDVPVRFDTDKFGLTLDNEDAGTIGSLPCIEVRE